MNALGNTIRDTVNALIAGKTPSVAKPVYTVLDTTRNTACWATGYDLSPILVARIDGYGYRSTGILLTPQDILYAGHNGPIVGTNARAVSMANVAYERTIESIFNHDDLRICHLATPFPNDISFARVLPTNWRTYLPEISTNQDRRGKLPAWCYDQDEQLLVWEWWCEEESTTGTLGYDDAPTDATRLSFWEQPIVGDSSGGMGIMINGLLVALGTLGSNSLTQHHDIINSGLASLGSAYTLTDVDLSDYPELLLHERHWSAARTAAAWAVEAR